SDKLLSLFVPIGPRWCKAYLTSYPRANMPSHLLHQRQGDAFPISELITLSNRPANLDRMFEVGATYNEFLPGSKALCYLPIDTMLTEGLLTPALRSIENLKVC